MSCLFPPSSLFASSLSCHPFLNIFILISWPVLLSVRLFWTLEGSRRLHGKVLRTNPSSSDAQQESGLKHKLHYAIS